MKKLTVAVCLDDAGGMMFFGKRQSRDRVLISEFMESFGNGVVRIADFSRLIFDGYEKVQSSVNPLDCADDGDVCFIENIHLTPYIKDVSTLVVYRWNRLYPSDFKFDVDILKSGFSLESVKEFEGSSHEKITKEIYRR